MKTFFELREAVQEKTLTPAEKKKREEIAQAMERDNPGMDMSKKMAIATAQAKKVTEDLDEALKVDTKIRMAAAKMKHKMEKEGKTPAQIAKAIEVNFPSLSESVELEEGKKGVILAFKDQYKSRDSATGEGQRAMKKYGGSSFSVYKSSNGLWAYKVFEGVEGLDEAGPKIKPDFVKVQRAKDAAHNAAMGRTATGRKKPVRTMTSTQRSMASMNKEEVELDEGISNLSHSRLKYHATKGVSHGSYSTAEIKDEHKRRLRSEPDYVKAKASMNEGIKAKPDATEVIRKKKQMAAISTSDKDKLSRIAQMMARANEGLEQDGPRKPGGDGLSKNFGKQYGKKADAYLDKKAKERRDQAAKNDPGASKKNLGPAVLDTDKADKKARAKGTSMSARFQNKMAAKK